jgi:hypothetical protein
VLTANDDMVLYVRRNGYVKIIMCAAKAAARSTNGCWPRALPRKSRRGGLRRTDRAPPNRRMGLGPGFAKTGVPGF